MNAVRIAALALIVAGALGLAYGSFSYHQGDSRSQGRTDRVVGEGQGDRQRPSMVGVGTIVIGGVLLLFGGKAR